MGRKKKKPIKPWCWYCNREFDDDKILTQHQRAKHYKCPFCHKKLYSGPGLTVHCVQVHKERLDKIPEALPNRNSVDIDIYGMQGIPEEDLREHERLKRGDDGRSSKPDQGNKQAQPNKSQPTTTHHHQQQQQQSNLFGASPMGLPPGTPMHAAMLKHAMSTGMMPPGFPMFPPGGPVSLPPGFMPPAGFPGMPPPPMHPGMPPPSPLLSGLPPPAQMLPGVPPPNFPPMLPTTTGSSSLPMDWPGILAPPPPPPPPPEATDEPLTSDTQFLAPMSGVGQLIGVPPPSFKQDTLPPPIKPQGNSQPKESDSGPERARQISPRPRPSPKSGDHETYDATSSASTTTTVTTSSTIARSAVITKSDRGTNLNVKSYIEVPSAKARIMHPDRDLSFEEIRLSLTKYKAILQGEKLLDTGN